MEAGNIPGEGGRPVAFPQLQHEMLGSLGRRAP